MNVYNEMEEYLDIYIKSLKTALTKLPINDIHEVDRLIGQIEVLDEARQHIDYLKHKEKNGKRANSTDT